MHFKDPGMWKVSFDIEWPALRVDEYTITVGVGEGTQVRKQIVQNWANHLFKVTSSLQGQEGDQLLYLPVSNVEAIRL